MVAGREENLVPDSEPFYITEKTKQRILEGETIRVSVEPNFEIQIIGGDKRVYTLEEIIAALKSFKRFTKEPPGRYDEDLGDGPLEA